MKDEMKDKIRLKKMAAQEKKTVSAFILEKTGML